MSIKCLSWVMEYSEATLGARLVLFVLAEHAHDDGSDAYPSVETLEERTRMSRRGVQLALRRLEADGEIVADGGYSRKGTVIYRVVMEERERPVGEPDDGGAESAPQSRNGGEPDDVEGANLTTSRGEAASPEPSRTVQGTVLSLERARDERAGKAVRYRSKMVPSVVVDGAERLLDVFRQEAGHGPGARSAAGDASPALKQVIGAMLARPDTSVDDWEAAIRRTVAAPPRWVDGALQIGHVFGERAAEWALSAGAPAMDGPSRLERMADELEAQGL